MSRRKTERLLSLVVCLLSSGRFLTATQIRAAVPGYPDSFDAFKRMFERDKDELRELGIPLETGSNSAADEEPGYRISRDRKSTRLNSSHPSISYAVFCLKKKTKHT